MTNITFTQIKAQLAAVRKKIPGTKSIAIRSKAKWAGNNSYEDNGEVFQIHQCDSPLAMRLALRESGSETTTVLVTDLDDHDISDDILVRLKPRKLIPLDSWQIVKALFQVRAVDPRVTRYGWMADALMDLIPPTGYPPVASGFLDAETVWGIILDHYLGLSGYSLDLLAVLKWSIDTKNVDRFCSAPQLIQEATSEWLVSTAGPTVAAVLNCAARATKSNGIAEALPLGLVAGVVFNKAAKGKLERAIGKLEEKYFDGHSPEYSIIERWSAAATEVVRLQLGDMRVKQSLVQRADEILKEVGAEAFAYLSDTSPIGFDLRLADFGKKLSLSIAGSKFDFETLIEARNSISQHDRHSRERRRLERVDMAMRLVRWLDSADSAKRGQDSFVQSTQGASSSQKSPDPFLPATTYEDFIQGYRPNPESGFSLRNGNFFNFVQRAHAEPELDFVFIIDEINRGNLSKVFGELMMLIEADKRSKDFAVPLTYSTDNTDTFYVPPNVHFIGTMNTADRSLSMVDYALRRRFAFVELDPEFESQGFHDHLIAKGATTLIVKNIRDRMGKLNQLINDDATNLGKGYRIGHSFFVPSGNQRVTQEWIDAIVEFEVLPLLEEYWCDDAKQIEKARQIALGHA